MTDSANGSVADANPPAGNPDANNGPAANGSAADAPKSFLDGLSEGNRKLAENKGWKSDGDIDKVFSSYAELERQQGESLRVPAQDAAADEWEKFYSKAGRPEKPDYEFKRPEGLPPELPYDETFANSAKPWLYEAGLNPRQAQIIHDRFAKFQADQVGARIADISKSVETTHDDLVKDWGPTDGEKFKGSLETANRAIAKLGLEEAFKKAGLILQDGSLTDASIARALHAVGSNMFREDSLADGGSGAGGENPWKTGHVSKQAQMVKNEPDRARTLIREAGKNPADYRL